MQRNETRAGRSAPLAQVGLAALVAGSLLAFSALAFRTAFNEGATPGSLTATTPRMTSAAPVLLPASNTETSTPAATATSDLVASADPAPRGDVVLGTRVSRTKDAARAAQITDERRASHSNPPSAQQEDWHKRRDGKGHEKAHGKGHHKPKDLKPSRDVEAREEEDEWDDHSDDDDGRDDDDDSDSSGGSGSGGSGSGDSGSHGSGGDHSGSGRG